MTRLAPVAERLAGVSLECRYHAAFQTAEAEVRA